MCCVKQSFSVNVNIMNNNELTNIIQIQKNKLIYISIVYVKNQTSHKQLSKH